MSSFSKNLIPRRAHKERAQPLARVAKHGLLEKKKDFKLRARDRNRKKLRVKLLKEKAAFRNPDEFYYGMARAVTDKGRVRRVANEKEEGRVPLEHRNGEQRMLAETQDGGYVGVKAGREEGKVRRMRGGLHFLGAAAVAKRQHVMFVDDEEQLKAFEQEGGVEVEGEARQGGKAGVTGEEGMNRTMKKRLRKSQARAYRELEQRVGRKEKLKTVLRDLDTEKALLSKGRRYLVRPADPVSGAPAVFRWQQERKK